MQAVQKQNKSPTGGADDIANQIMNSLLHDGKTREALNRFGLGISSNQPTARKVSDELAKLEGLVATFENGGSLLDAMLRGERPEYADSAARADALAAYRREFENALPPERSGGDRGSEYHDELTSMHKKYQRISSWVDSTDLELRKFEIAGTDRFANHVSLMQNSTKRIWTWSWNRARSASDRPAKAYAALNP